MFNSGTGLGLPHWGSGNVYHEDADGNPFYDFTIADCRTTPKPSSRSRAAPRSTASTKPAGGPIRRRTTPSGPAWSPHSPSTAWLRSTAAVPVDLDALGNGSPEEVDAIASRSSSDGSLAVIVWRYADDRYAEDAAPTEVELEFTGLIGAWTVEHWRIDRDHSNSHTVWQALVLKRREG